MHNPIYCGIILVPPYEDEDIQFDKGQHELTISESLFYEAQDVLNGNKNKPAIKFVSTGMLPYGAF